MMRHVSACCGCHLASGALGRAARATCRRKPEQSHVLLSRIASFLRHSQSAGEVRQCERSTNSDCFTGGAGRALDVQEGKCGAIRFGSSARRVSALAAAALGEQRSPGHDGPVDSVGAGTGGREQDCDGGLTSAIDEVYAELNLVEMKDRVSAFRRSCSLAVHVI